MKSQLETLTITLGEGVRGRIDTMIVCSGALGADETKTISIVRPRGYRVQYSIVADHGYHNVLVVLDDDTASARGILVLDGDRELLAGAERRLNISREHRRAVVLPAARERTATLLRIDGSLSDDELGA
jgi:hypothetical protein